MPRRISLPSGAWADLAEPDELTERRRRPVQKTQMKAMKAMVAAGVDKTQPPHPSPETRATMTPGELAALDQQQNEWMTQVFMAVDIDDALEADAAYIAAFTLAWSFDTPVSADTVLDIPPKDYATLKAEVKPLVQAAFLDTSPQELTAESPTEPSNA